MCHITLLTSPSFIFKWRQELQSELIHLKFDIDAAKS